MSEIQSAKILLASLITLLLLVVVTLIGYCYGRLPNSELPPTKIDTQKSIYFQELQRACEQDKKGQWLQDYKECQFLNNQVDEKWCTKAGGEFTHCASACRHRTGKEIINCVAMCVKVCKF